MSNGSMASYVTDTPSDIAELLAEIKELKAKNDNLERKLSSIIDDCIAENAYEFSQHCQSIDYGYTKQISKLEAKNVELENKLNNPLCTSFLYEHRINEIEKKLKVACEALERMDRCFPDCSSYHVNTKCDCNSGIAFEALSKIKSEGL